MVQDDNLRFEVGNFSCGIIFVIRSNISSSDIFNRDTFNVESYVVTWGGFGELFVVHFNGFNFSGDVRRSKANLHVGFNDSGFNSSDWDSSNTSNLVNIL